jgi:CHAT domain-containing protein/tetratricopeptide (TPR) repeat protein
MRRTSSTLNRSRLQIIKVFCAFAIIAGICPHASADNKALKRRWDELNRQILALFHDGKNEDALSASQEMLGVAEQINARGDLIGYSSSMVGSALYRLRRWSDAEPYFVRALAAYQTSVKEDDPSITNILSVLAKTYAAENKNTESELTWLRLIDILEKKHGSDSYEVADARYSLAAIYGAEGRYRESGALLESSLARLQKHFGNNSSQSVGFMTSIAGALARQGRSIEAEGMLRRALQIQEEHRAKLDRNNLSDRTMWVNLCIEVSQNQALLAEVLGKQGKYREAERLFGQAIATQAEAFSGNELEDYIADTLQRQAVLYIDMGRYEDAESAERRAMLTWARGGLNSKKYLAYSLTGLSAIDVGRGRYNEAISHAQQALEVIHQVLPPDHEEVALFLNNLAETKSDLGKEAEAEPLLRSALSILEKQWGAGHPKVVLQLSNLSGCLRQLGRYPEAEEVALRAIAILRKERSTEPTETLGLLTNLADVYWAEGKPELAKPQLMAVGSVVGQQLRDVLPYGSERDRLEFLATSSRQFAHFCSFVSQFRNKDSELVGAMYDRVLQQKGIVAAGLATARRLIRQQHDPEASRLLTQISIKRSQMAALAHAGLFGKEQQTEGETLGEEIRDLERQLSERSAGLTKPEASPTWSQIQSVLKPGDAAIEFVRYERHDGVRWTGKSQYAALVLTKETHGGPIFVDLGDASRLEQGVNHQRSPASAKRRIQVAEPVELDDFWSALEPALQTANRLYLSPDGLLQEFSFDALKTSEGKYVTEKYDLQVLSSTRDLLGNSEGGSDRIAVLIGDPDFNLTNEEWETARAEALRLPQPEAAGGVADLKTGTRSDLIAAEGNLRSADPEYKGALQPLPGTAAELLDISSLLAAHGWKVETRSGHMALEEVVKRIHHPTVLHLATHGFFLQQSTIHQLDSSEKITEDPMLRSGLFFAGANRALAHQPIPAGDDGILTALEASELDLQGTELVVLSACGTGLGSIQNGEGVFGLRRALQLAGARSVLMSLWAVPDRETTELMSLFYGKWLSGQSKHQALREAEGEMRQRVIERYGTDLPFYWGAFVLVGR